MKSVGQRNKRDVTHWNQSGKETNVTSHIGINCKNDERTGKADIYLRFDSIGN